MSRFVDLTGDVFGTLIVIQTSDDPAITGKARSHSYCYCSKYDCYNWVLNTSLLKNKTNSGRCFTFKPLPNNLIVDNELVGVLRQHTWSISVQGYYKSYVYKVHTLVHQYVWFLKTGENLVGTNIQLDHINRNRADNRIDNLRKASNYQNSLNSSKMEFKSGVKTTSQYKGVYFCKSKNKWLSRVRLNQVDINLGGFNTEEEAYQVRLNYIQNNATSQDLKFWNI